MSKSKLKIVARNYEWDCGDGCCSESRRQIIFLEDNSVFRIVDLYNDTPPESKDEMIHYLKTKNVETNVDNDIFKEYLKKDFEFVHTTDEYDYC